MCLLAAYAPGIPVNASELQNGVDRNPDGSGFAILTAERHLIVQKRMKGEKLVPLFEKLRNKHPDSYALFHSRIGTGGTLSVENCHPFRITDQSVIAHNGIIYTVPAGEIRSDTRIFAETKMRYEYRRWQRIGVRDQIESFIGPSNKMVIISAHPAKPPMVILNKNQGITTDTGVWYSNDSYKKFTYSYSPRYSYNWHKRECYMCEVIGSIEFDQCTLCGSCVFCGSVNCDGKECASCPCKVRPVQLRHVNISASAECVTYECPQCDRQWERLWRRWDRPAIGQAQSEYLG